MEHLSFEEQINHIWQNLWFLRPEWLYAFIPIGLLLGLMLLNMKTESKWKKRINPKLLPFVTIKGNKKTALIPKIILLVFLSLVTLSVAGPTWEKIDLPGEKTEAVLLVLLDVSNSMLAEDIQPNRLERAKLKLKDFFDANPKSKVGLVAYAGTAHSVVPFSKDYKTINRQVEALRPDIMPIQGSILTEALNLADSLLNPILAPSNILVVTDNIEQDMISRLSQTAAKTHIEIMTISTPSGSTIPIRNRDLKDANGDEVITRLDPIVINQLKEIDNINSVTVTLDNSDVEILATRISNNLIFELDKENTEDEWIDAGYLLIPILLFFSLMSFRRGWRVQWVWLLLISYACDDTQKLNKDELFYTKDQQAQRYLEKGDSLKAAETYTSGNQKGYIYYSMGDLDKAAEAYGEDVSAEGFYNLGVVYYEMGDYESARQAFNSALEIDPNLEVAKDNLEVTVKAIESSQSEGPLPFEDASKSAIDPDEFQEYTETADEKDVAQESDKKYEGEGDVQEMVTKEVDENTIDVFEFDENVVIDKETAKQTLLRQVTEDPSIFLRRKFAYQIRGKKIKKPKKNW